MERSPPLHQIMRIQPRLEKASSNESASGFTLVELLIAMTILSVAMLGAVGTLTQISSLAGSNRESTLAYQSARAMLERVQAVPFEEALQRFNDDPADDPAGPGSAEGMHFAVPGLNLQATDDDGFCGRVLLPGSGTTSLREDLVDAGFGLPADLNGDGVIDGVDHSADKILLPIRVQVEWIGMSGERTAGFSTVLGKRR